MAERRLRKSQLQNHFMFKKLVSPFMTPPQEDDADRTVYVTDSNGKTSKASKNEYYVAKALLKLGLQFQFQVTIAGGRQQAFGIVLDFLVMTVPMPTPLWVHGEHWHSGARRAKDLRQQDKVREEMQGAVNEPKEIWGSESDTEERAFVAVRNIFA
jgi:hypothetical protein